MLPHAKDMYTPNAVCRPQIPDSKLKEIVCAIFALMHTMMRLNDGDDVPRQLLNVGC